MKKVLIVCESRLLGDIWSSYLAANSRLEIAGIALSKKSAVQMAREHQPQLVLLHSSQTHAGILTVVRSIHRHSKGAQTVILWENANPRAILQLYALGVRGYVSIDSSLDHVRLSLLAAIEGGQYFCPVSERRANTPTSSGPSFSHAELLIIFLLKEGNDSREIARRLRVTVGAVNSCRQRILSKLRLKSTAQLIRYLEQNDTIGVVCESSAIPS